MFENEHLSEEEIALYVDASLKGNINSVDAKLKNHIRNCDDCAEKILAVLEITEDFHISGQTHTVKINSFKKNYWIQIAASIVIVIGLGVIVYQIRQTNNNPIQQFSEIIDTTITKIDSINLVKSDTKEIIAQNEKDSTPSFKQMENSITVNKNLLAYAEYPELEKLVERFTEATFRGDFTVNIKSTIEIKTNEELVFEWNNEKQEILILEFFNNKNEKLFEEETSKNIFHTNRLTTPGLYYWKLLNEDFDLLFCGKIIVQ